MEIVLWITGLVLVVSGLVLTIQRHMVWGVSLILGGMLSGLGASAAM